MLDWLISNLGTIIIGIIVFGCAAAVVFSMARKKKNGKSSCSCGCSGCPLSGQCHSHTSGKSDCTEK